MLRVWNKKGQRREGEDILVKDFMNNMTNKYFYVVSMMVVVCVEACIEMKQNKRFKKKFN
jgi:hypothetical protein